MLADTNAYLKWRSRPLSPREQAQYDAERARFAKHGSARAVCSCCPSVEVETSNPEVSEK